MLWLVVSSCTAGSSKPPSSDAGTSDGGAHTPDGGSKPTKLSYSPCPLLTEPGTPPPSGPIEVKSFDGAPSPIGQLLAMSGGLDDLASAQAECATTPLPAKWSEPQGDTIDVFVKRYPARQQPANGQLWLLAGGPGLPGSIYEAFAFLIANDLPTLDIYLPDHRGTGRSMPLATPMGPPIAKIMEPGGRRSEDRSR